MKNFRRFRKWCAKNANGIDGAAAASNNANVARKLIIAALCGTLFICGALGFGIKAFGDTMSDDTEEISASAAAVKNIDDNAAVNCMGADIDELSEAAIRFGLPQGAAVGAVSDGTPAAEAGIKAGDIVTAVNGEAVNNICELTAAVDRYHSCSELIFSVYRHGDELEMIVNVCEDMT